MAPRRMAPRRALRRRTGSSREPPRAQDVVDVRLLGLVVEAERVHHEVDPEAKGLLALLVAARNHLVLPAAEAVARERALEIVLRVDDGQPAVALDALDVRRREDAAGRAAQ